MGPFQCGREKIFSRKDWTGLAVVALISASQLLTFAMVISRRASRPAPRVVNPGNLCGELARWNLAITQPLNHSTTQPPKHPSTQSLNHSSTQASQAPTPFESSKHPGTQAPRHSSTQALEHSSSHARKHPSTQAPPIGDWPLCRLSAKAGTKRALRKPH
jgi:hypothetical protein